MLGHAELMHLSRWCHARKRVWQPARNEEGMDGVLLRKPAETPWGGTLVLADDDGFRLVDMLSNVLAAASDLPALLDALDAGIGETPVSTIPHGSYTARPSPSFWNSPGSAIT